MPSPSSQGLALHQGTARTEEVGTEHSCMRARLRVLLTGLVLTSSSIMRVWGGGWRLNTASWLYLAVMWWATAMFASNINSSINLHTTQMHSSFIPVSLKSFVVLFHRHIFPQSLCVRPHHKSPWEHLCRLVARSVHCSGCPSQSLCTLIWTLWRQWFKTVY